MKTTTQQIKILKKLFPKLSLKIDKKLKGYVIPHFKQFGTYNEAVEAVLNKIGKTRRFFNWREGKLDENYLRQTKEKIKFWENQPEAIVLNAQMGEKYKGKSVEEVRKIMKNEIGLGAYEVGIILLIHPELLKSKNDLYIDCPGDEYSLFADGNFRRDPYFFFHDGRVKFGTGWVDYAHESFGSASAFLPQSESELKLEPLTITISEVIINNKRIKLL